MQVDSLPAGPQGKPKAQGKSGLVCVKLAQSCPTLCDPMDCSLPCSSIRGILQARILEWVAISFQTQFLGQPNWDQICTWYKTLQYMHHELSLTASSGVSDQKMFYMEFPAFKYFQKRFLKPAQYPAPAQPPSSGNFPCTLNLL